MITTVSIPKILPNGLSLCNARLDYDQYDNFKYSSNQSKSVTIPGSDRLEFRVESLRLNGENYTVKINRGDSVKLCIIRDKAPSELNKFIDYNWCNRDQYDYSTKKQRIHSAHIRLVPRTHKFLLTDTKNTAHSAILQNHKELMKREKIIVLSENTTPCTYLERVDTFRTHSHSLQERKTKTMAAMGLYINKNPDDPNSHVLKCQTCFFETPLDPKEEHTHQLKKDHKYVHKEDKTEKHPYSKIPAFMINDTEVPYFKVHDDSVDSYSYKDDKWHGVYHPKFNETLLIPSTNSFIHISELFSKEYETSMLKRFLDTCQEEVTSIQSAVSENQRKTAHLLGKPIPATTPPSWMSCALELKPALKTLLNMAKMAGFIQQQGNNPADNHNCSMALEHLKVDIQRHLENMQSTLCRYQAQTGEVPSLQYLVAEQSHVKAERTSESDLLPDGCRSRAKFGTELLGAITTEIIYPLMECPETQDLYQTHLATLLGVTPNPGKV